ncbi:ESX-1 secretion-associated protein EspK-like [Schistocerca americana]|uniref:ESX-1 secretion-associated protein EspK-like n=1 Tax=Schistocerca americana TaxID=7009 RepID=UPI001F4F48FA|nr:ESX-1 secretion-associated protein EspK-like [Schistocerca americana]
MDNLVRGGFQPRLPTSLPPPGQQQQPSPLPRRQPVPLMHPAQLHPGAPQVVAPAPAVPLQSPPPSELMDVDPSAGPPSQAVAVQPVLQPLSLGTPKESDIAAPCPAPTQQPSTQRQETLPLFVGPDAPSRPVPEAAPVVTGRYLDTGVAAEGRGRGRLTAAERRCGASEHLPQAVQVCVVPLVEFRSLRGYVTLPYCGRTPVARDPVATAKARHSTSAVNSSMTTARRLPVTSDWHHADLLRATANTGVPMLSTARDQLLPGRDRTSVLPIYRVSYLWNNMMRLVVTLAAALAISLVTGKRDLASVDKSLVTPLMRWVLPKGRRASATRVDRVRSSISTYEGYKVSQHQWWASKCVPAVKMQVIFTNEQKKKEES